MNLWSTHNRGRIAASLSAMAALLLSPLVMPAEAQTEPPAAPAFSSDIVSLFAGAPFQTCLIGQFEPGATDTSASDAHYWFVRAEQTGTLTVEIQAVSVNPAESGSIVAQFFDGAADPSIQVFHPTGTFAGDLNSALMSVAVQAGGIYRLEIQRGPVQGTAEAHHYKLGLSGLSVDVGVNSPTFRYLEPEPQVYHLNLGAGEGFSFTLFTDFGLPSSPQATIEISRRDNGQVLLTQAGAPPLNIALPNPFGGAAGTLVSKITANLHYRLDKLANPSPEPLGDRGVYFDTCPPPPPPPPVSTGPRTIGFWKNHEQETTARLPVPLGNYLVDSFAKARAVLDEAHAKNAYEMLAAQLLAARLNSLVGVPTGCVADAIEQANNMLVFAGYAGPGSTQPPADKEAVNAVKDKLDQFNNEGCP